MPQRQMNARCLITMLPSANRMRTCPPMRSGPHSITFTTTSGFIGTIASFIAVRFLVPCQLNSRYSPFVYTPPLPPQTYTNPKRKQAYLTTTGGAEKLPRPRFINFRITSRLEQYYFYVCFGFTDAHFTFASQPAKGSIDFFFFQFRRFFQTFYGQFTRLIQSIPNLACPCSNNFYIHSFLRLN